MSRVVRRESVHFGERMAKKEEMMLKSLCGLFFAREVVSVFDVMSGKSLATKQLPVLL